MMTFPFANHRTLAEVENEPIDHRDIERIVVERMTAGASALEVSKEVGRDQQSVKGIWSAHCRRRYAADWAAKQESRMAAKHSIKEVLAEWKANAKAVIDGAML